MFIAFSRPCPLNQSLTVTLEDPVDSVQILHLALMLLLMTGDVLLVAAAAVAVVGLWRRDPPLRFVSVPQLLQLTSALGSAQCGQAGIAVLK